MGIRTINRLMQVIVGVVFFTGCLRVVQADGLPGEYLVTQRWRELLMKHSPLTNPALMTEENYLAERLILSPMMQGEFKLWEMGGIYPIGLYQSGGLSWLGQTSDEYAEVVNGTATGNQVRYQENFFMGTWAIYPWNGLSAGVNINLLHQMAFDEQRIGFGTDLGLSYRLRRHAFLGNHIATLTAQNLLAPADGVTAFSRNLKLGLLSSFLEDNMESWVAVDIKDFLAKAEEFQAGNSSSIEWDFTTMIGYDFLQTLKITAMAGFDTDGLQFWAMSAGLNIPSSNRGRDMELAYQYSLMRDDDATSHTFYHRAEFGLHREEIYARAMAKKIDIAPNNIYVKAQKYYSKGEYWKAFILFNRILSEYPDFFKNDRVTFYVGGCQERMDMREAAENSYMAVRNDFPRSKVLSSAELGLMRLYYREQKYKDVAEQYAILNKPGVEDDEKFEAYYIMGQSHMAQKEYEPALELLNAIPKDHPDYLYAQHSIAIALLATGKPEVAALVLQDCAQQPERSAAETELINRTYLFLAYILYHDYIKQERSLSRAISILRLIPPTSIYYEEAVLGAAWCGIKAQQWNDVLEKAQELVGSGNSIFQLEGMLLKAYAHILLKDNAAADKVLTEAERKMNNLAGPQERELLNEKQQYIGTRTSYDFIAKRAVELARTTQTNATVAQLDSLHQQQRETKKSIDKSLRYFDSFKRAELFARGLPKIKEDISFITAYIAKKRTGAKTQKAINKIDKKEESVDKQIEELEKELEKMDPGTGKQD